MNNFLADSASLALGVSVGGTAPYKYINIQSHARFCSILFWRKKYECRNNKSDFNFHEKERYIFKTTGEYILPREEKISILYWKDKQNGKDCHTPEAF